MQVARQRPALERRVTVDTPGCGGRGARLLLLLWRLRWLVLALLPLHVLLQSTKARCCAGPGAHWHGTRLGLCTCLGVQSRAPAAQQAGASTQGACITGAPASAAGASIGPKGTLASQAACSRPLAEQSACTKRTR